MKLVFIVFFLSAFLLAFYDLPIPVSLAIWAFERVAPVNLVLHLDSLSVGFHKGLRVSGLRLFDSSRQDPLKPVVQVSVMEVHPLSRVLRIDGASFLRLSDSYYGPENHSKNERVECELPEIPRFTLELVRSNILGIEPERVIADVESTHNRVSFSRIHLDWPDVDEKMSIDGFCSVDLADQEVRGEIKGLARQPHIRPLLVALDVPVSLPYFDGFTDVPESVPSTCGWKVNLVNNDFDLYLHLKPKLGKYNLVPMKWADGRIHLHVYTRDDCLNYHQTIGPIIAEGPKGQPLEGTVIVDGTNHYNTVDVEAKSALPVADILKIGGFTGDYVNNDVFGDSSCKLQFRFPRAMTNNYEVMDGEGHILIKNGQLMRMKGFKGLLDVMPSIAPAVSWFSDSTQGSCDYVIEKGVLKSDNIYIEGSMFSIKMYGEFDTVKNTLDFTVRVQFTKKDSLVGTLLHPLTWPFTKLLLEFKLTGTPDDPQWHYVSVIDRVLEVVK